jgi:hypothetical protein
LKTPYTGNGYEGGKVVTNILEVGTSEEVWVRKGLVEENDERSNGNIGLLRVG